MLEMIYGVLIVVTEDPCADKRDRDVGGRLLAIKIELVLSSAGG
jgi:hypothetical protein